MPFHLLSPAVVNKVSPISSLSPTVTIHLYSPSLLMSRSVRVILLIQLGGLQRALSLNFSQRIVTSSPGVRGKMKMKQVSSTVVPTRRLEAGLGDTMTTNCSGNGIYSPNHIGISNKHILLYTTSPELMTSNAMQSFIPVLLKSVS